MKNIAILFFLALSAVANATNYYISPSGNDSNNGSQSSPFFSLNKAWSVVTAGDVIYARGGVYKFNSRQNLTGKSGTSTNKIRIEAYPGERPVFTKSSNFTTSSWPVCLIYVTSSYIYLKGLEVAYFTQATSAIWYGIAVLGANNNTFEQINSHHNGHGMVIRDESNHNLVLNCDFHNNYDPLTSGDSYGNADGLEVGYQSGSMENTIRGCRIWNNSDDGIDLWNNNGNVIIDGCWAWNNGYREDGRTTGGDGGGIKFGSTTTATGTEFKRTVTNCLSVYNRSKGFNQNGAKVKFYFYNNTAYKNPQGIVFYDSNLPNIYRNNICYNNGTNWVGQFSNAVKDHNSYDAGLPSSGPSVSTSDFVSTDTTGISGKRGSDGSMPAISFMKLASSSRLIDAGIDVGLPFNGTAPDLGPFETKNTTSTTTSMNLAYVSSSVKSTSPSQVDVTYNSALASITPPPSSYDIKVNSVSRTVSKITLADNNVSLTLDSPVKSGDQVTLSYIKPDISPLQCTHGTIAETITAKSVSNMVQAPAAPVYVSSVIENSAPDIVNMTYDVSLANIIPGTSSFLLKANRVSKQVKAVTIAGNKVTITLTAALTRNDTVTVTYTKPATNPLQTGLGGIAESITDKAVTNNILGVITSTEPPVTGGKISISPNPATNLISIANFNFGNQGAVLKIFDFGGILVQEVKLTDPAKLNDIPINLKSGFYITQLMIGSIVRYVQKLIVVK